MIKQIWTIRSTARLFNNLNFVISIFILFYTILNILVLPQKIDFSFPAFTKIYEEQSKFMLLIVPILSVGICMLLYKSITNTKAMIIKAKSTDRSKVAKLKLKHDSFIGINFMITLTLAFLQVELLNSAKQLDGFSIYPIIICLVVLVGYSINIMVKYRKLK